MEEERLYVLDEDIDILKEMIFIFDNIGVGSLLNESQYIGIKRLIEMNERLIEAYKKVKEENKRIKSIDYIALAEEVENGLWMPRCDVEEYYIPIENLDDYIPKSKIKEKIEKLEKEKNTVIEEINFKAFYRITDLKNVEISVLQELLQEEK